MRTTWQGAYTGEAASGLHDPAYDAFCKAADAGGWRFSLQLSFMSKETFTNIEDTYELYSPSLGEDARVQLHKLLMGASGDGIYPAQKEIAKELLWRLLLAKASGLSESPEFQGDLFPMQIFLDLSLEAPEVFCMSARIGQAQ